METAMNSAELFERRDELKHVIGELREELKGIEDQLEDLYKNLARDALRADGKDFGTTTIHADGLKLKANVAKKVVWDQTKLANWLSQQSEENARHYGKLTFAVEERKYTAAPPDIRAQLEECRTTEVGSFKVEIV